MKLKKLSLQGYKTFASRTDFLFDEGITAVVGPNGGGKSTLVKIAGLQLHPSSGRVFVLGTELGTADIRTLRSSIGLSSTGLVDQLRGSLTGEEIVRCVRSIVLSIDLVHIFRTKADCKPIIFAH